MAARICMQLLCIKLCRMTRKQGQICDKLCRKAVNLDFLSVFRYKTSGTLPHFRFSYLDATDFGLLKIGKPDSQSPENRN